MVVEEAGAFVAVPELDADAADVAGVDPRRAAMKVARSTNRLGVGSVDVVGALVAVAWVGGGDVGEASGAEAGATDVKTVFAVDGAAGGPAAAVAAEAVAAGGVDDGGVGVVIDVFEAVVVAAGVVAAAVLEVAPVEAVVPVTPAGFVGEDAVCNWAMKACRSVIRVDASALSEAAEEDV